MFGKPPEVVPDDLSAREYHILARWYEEADMKAQARTAYERELQLEATGADAVSARFALKVRLFEVDVPASVRKEIARSHFLVTIRPSEVQKLALKTIQDYPLYGAAHCLLAETYLSESKSQACIDSLQTALKCNPDDLQALTVMAQVHCANFDYAQARRFITQAAELSSTNEEVRAMRRTIDVLDGMDDESCPISEQVSVLTKRLRNSRKDVVSKSSTT